MVNGEGRFFDTMQLKLANNDDWSIQLKLDKVSDLNLVSENLLFSFK